jgi:flagellar motility protein MotE (MotC chaperone)
MIRLLKSNWTASTLGTLLYLLITWMLCRPLAQVPIVAAREIKPRTVSASWAFSNPEVDQLISELKEEKQALATKEKELKDLAARLQTERAELCQITQTVYQLQQDFDSNITRVREDEVGNLKKLAKNYSAMTPEGAAAIFNALDDGTVVRVMSFMKESDTAPILEFMAKQSAAQAKRVAAISERIRLSVNNFKKTPSS